MIGTAIHRHPSSSSRSSASSMDDMITAAPTSPPPSQPPPAHFIPQPTMSDSASTHSCSSTSSHLTHSRTTVGSCAGLSTDELEHLWECMLELQHLYGCYKSARMQAALCLWEQGLEPDFMPSRGALDLLNDGIEELPEEGWRMLGKFVSVEGRQHQERRGRRWTGIWKRLSRDGWSR